MFSRPIIFCLRTCITENIWVTGGCKQFPQGLHVGGPWSNGARNVYSLDREDGGTRLLHNISDYQLTWHHIAQDLNLLLIAIKESNPPKFEATQRVMHKCP
jgi:hypothetical protein